MKPTIDYVQQRFERFNREIFGGKLPPVEIVLSNAKSFSGQCAFKTKRTLLGGLKFYDFKLKFSTRIDFDEDELDDIIVHEMIHYYIGYFQLKDTSSHGKIFRRFMDEINRKHGRHVAVTHHTSHAQALEAAEAVRRWHVVAVVSFGNGKRGIKVLPRVERSILSYYKAISDNRCGTTGVELYMTDHPYFNRFPSSSALRVYFPDMHKVADALVGARPMPCDGQRVEWENK